MDILPYKLQNNRSITSAKSFNRSRWILHHSSLLICLYLTAISSSIFTSSYLINSRLKYSYSSAMMRAISNNIHIQKITDIYVSMWCLWLCWTESLHIEEWPDQNHFSQLSWSISREFVVSLLIGEIFFITVQFFGPKTIQSSFPWKIERMIQTSYLHTAAVLGYLLMMHVDVTQSLGYFPSKSAASSRLRMVKKPVALLRPFARPVIALQASSGQ